MKRTIPILLLLLLWHSHSYAVKGGVDGVVFTTGEDRGVQYSSKIGDVSRKGISIIGVVRAGKDTEALVTVSRADSAVSAVTTDWLGVKEKKIDYATQRQDADSLVLYSFLMGIMEGDTVKLNSDILVGGMDNRMYCAAFDIKESQYEPIVDYNLYGKTLSFSERGKVESYYAIRYGLTLNQTTPTDYVDSKGDVIWNAEQNAEYPNAIAGIGVDSGSELVHLKGQSIKSGEPEISVSDTVSDGMYLMWSRNDGQNRFQTAEGEDIGKLEREWTVTPTGNWRNTPVTVRFNVEGDGGLPRIGEGEEYWLEVDTTSYRAANTGSGIVQFGGVLFSGNSHFTVATRSGVDENIENIIRDVTIYPSPTLDGNIKMSITLGKKTDVNIRIYNSVGQVITDKVLQGAWYYEYQGSLPVPGMYVVMANAGGYLSTFKVERR